MIYETNTTLSQPGTLLNFSELAEGVRASYRDAAAKYREDDEVEITTEHHRHLKGILGTISSSFGRPISVLEAGCGTGRYFYCLKNIKRLIGIDISEEMLKIAEDPVKAAEISAADVQLECKNVYLTDFPSGSFDMIYSLGMFGNGCPVTTGVCEKFYDWLAPGGKLFFDAVDMATLPFFRRVRRRIRNATTPLLPKTLKDVFDRREGPVPFFGLDASELERIMRATRFSNFSVSSQICESPLWQGVHLECAASKPYTLKMSLTPSTGA